MSLLFNNNIENTKVYAFVGPSGTGKSYIALSIIYYMFRNKKTIYIVPSLAIAEHLKEIINSGENFIVNDTKEEYYKTFMPTLKENGYKTYLINYKDALNSNGFNPLIVPYKLYKSGNKDLAIDEINNIC